MHRSLSHSDVIGKRASGIPNWDAQTPQRYGSAVSSSSPVLHTVTVRDDPAGWEQAGFTLLNDADASGAATQRVDLGGISVVFDADATAPISWTFDGITGGNDGLVNGALDGIPTTAAANPVDDEQTEATNPNGVYHLDHAVMISPSLARTVPALEAAGFEVRRRRDIPQGRQQVFLWAGPTIIELVGPVDADEHLSVDEQPSSLWGLAMSTRDIDHAADTLGEAMGRAKEAVQPGRRIATVRTKDLGITPTIALLTPHTA